MNADGQDDIKDLLKSFEENPYNPDLKTPEDVMRIFYIDDVQIVPVISKRNVLLGVITKGDIVAEMSDIERYSRSKIDMFISKLARKMTLDELLPFVSHHKEYTVVNLFGEPVGRWSRLDLIAAVEQPRTEKAVQGEIERQREDQVMEWMIYLILEHIPRPLYGLNHAGKTFFYNDHFESLYRDHTGNDVDTGLVETTFSAAADNEFFKRTDGTGDMYFYNKPLNMYYEKVPLSSGGETKGYLIFVDSSLAPKAEHSMPNINMHGLSLAQKTQECERCFIVESLKKNALNLDKTASELKITKQSLLVRAKKYHINLKDDK